MSEIRWTKADGSNRITFEYAEDLSESIETSVEGGVPVIHANRAGLTFLAKVFGKMATGPHTPGFHVHLGRNLDADAPEMLRIILTESPKQG
jgi:hypothetical protein